MENTKDTLEEKNGINDDVRIMSEFLKTNQKNSKIGSK